MIFKQLSLALWLAGAATLSHAITITAQNKCDKPVPYKVERKGSTLNTSLSQRTSTSHNLDNGDRIKVGNSVAHTVSSSSAGKTVIICNK
jgi:hypothetical protein